MTKQEAIEALAKAIRIDFGTVLADAEPAKIKWHVSGQDTFDGKPEPDKPEPGEHATPVMRHITYCEHAPPREIVESLIVQCGSGLEGGKPVMAPTVWTYAMKREWERHEAWWVANEGLVVHRADPELSLPRDVDRLGNHVGLGFCRDRPFWMTGNRCCLCGGWIRIADIK